MKKKLAALALTILLFILIFKNINLRTFQEAALEINWNYLIPALLYFLIYPFIGIERWRRMVALRHSFRFRDAFKIYFIGESLNLALPSKAGDLSKGYFLKKAQVSTYAFGMSSVVFEKFLDILSLGFA